MNNSFLIFFKILIVTVGLITALFYGILFGYDPIIAIGLLVAVVCILVFYYKENWGIYLALFAIPFDRLAILYPGAAALTVAKLVILTTMIVWFSRRIIAKDNELFTSLFNNPLSILSLLFLFLSFTSVANASEKGMWIAHQIRRTNLVVLYILLITIIKDKKVLIRGIWFTLIADFFVGLTGIYELVTQTQVLDLVGLDAADFAFIGDEQTRIVGPSGDPDFHAATMIFPATLVLFMLYRYKSYILKIILTFLLMLFFINMVGTGSRGGMMGLLISLITFGYLIKFKRKKIVVMVMALLMVIGFGLISLSGSAPTDRLTGQGGGKTLDYRLGWTVMGLRMIADYPFGGTGTGHFVSNYHRYRHRVPTVPNEPYYTHNSFLEVWLENGTPALPVYIGIYLVSAFNLFKVIKFSANDEIKALAIALMGTLLGFSFFAITSNILQNENYWILFACSVIILNLYKKEKEKGFVYESV